MGGAIIGSIGLIASGNINPDGDGLPSMYEPVHSSAPDIAGKGIANPIATVLAGALMLRDLGETDAADQLEKAVEQVIVGDVKTPDLGGTSTTHEVSLAIQQAL